MTFHTSNIYDPTKARDPKGTAPWQRAVQIQHMCATLILASDSAMNIDFKESILGPLEVMHQLADELFQQLDPFTPIPAPAPAPAPAAPAKPAARGKARPISDIYDAILRTEALTNSAAALAYDRTNLTDAGSPPIIALLDMLKDELARLSDDLSELEHVEGKSAHQAQPKMG